MKNCKNVTAQWIKASFGSVDLTQRVVSSIPSDCSGKQKFGELC